MSWLGGLFLDSEDAREVSEDPFRCPWCRKPLDATRLENASAAECQLVDAVLRMRVEGRTMKHVLHYVRLAWEHRGH